MIERFSYIFNVPAKIPGRRAPDFTRENYYYILLSSRWAGGRREKYCNNIIHYSVATRRFSLAFYL